jgi:hypothetical protein
MRWLRVLPPLVLIASCGDGAEPGDVPTRLIEVSGVAEFAAVPLDTVTGALAVRVTDLALGDDRACGVREGGQVYCWGRAFAGPVPGVDTNTVWPLPVTSAPPMDSLALTG